MATFGQSTHSTIGGETKGWQRKVRFQIIRVVIYTNIQGIRFTETPSSKNTVNVIIVRNEHKHHRAVAVPLLFESHGCVGGGGWVGQVHPRTNAISAGAAGEIHGTQSLPATRYRELLKSPNKRVSISQGSLSRRVK